MANISASELAQEVLRRCLAGASWQCPEYDQLIQQALDPDTAREASRALFSVLIEGLADRFDPALCEAYAELFTEAVGRVLPEVWPADLVARYERIRQVRPFTGDPESIRHIFVLSRITLGADVVVTSTVMAGLKERFPKAQIFLAGPKKNYELFAADARVEHLPVEYRRGGTLADRLQVWPELQVQLQHAPHSLVVDPDSRLTQLGLLPVCPEEQYFFLESRAFGSDSEEPLVHLAQRWTEWTFGVSGAVPYLAPDERPAQRGGITVSLGVGENENKRLPDPFEAELLKLLVRTGRPVCIDSGAGGGEAERVKAAMQVAGGAPELWSGSFASFAARVQQSDLYVGYDSAGQHVAAASGVPLISVFAGFVADRMFARWKPVGSGECTVLRVDDPPRVNEVLNAVRGKLAG